jgi:hypothetical protein
MYKAILAENPGLINVQMDAAYNYQTWAGTSDNPKIVRMYEAAAAGTVDPKTKRPVVWGWEQVSNKIARDTRFTPQFYEARYNLALCRFKYGLAQKDSQLREKLVNLAGQDIVHTAKLFPDLGGDQWRGKFDTLLKTIQREQGEKNPRGLAAVAQDNAATTPVGLRN